jgi:hypothetical protein
MRAAFRTLALLALFLGPIGSPALAQPAPGGPPPAASDTFTPGELVGAGHRFFGQEGGGAVVVGLRYGEGMLYTKNAGDLKVYWQGPSLGWDVGGEGARTMMLIYNLPATNAIYQHFAGVDGSAYFIGGFGMTVLTSNRIVLIPIRSGVGVRLGANVGYLKFTDRATWNPF